MAANVMNSRVMSPPPSQAFVVAPGRPVRQSATVDSMRFGGVDRRAGRHAFSHRGSIELHSARRESKIVPDMRPLHDVHRESFRANRVSLEGALADRAGRGHEKTVEGFPQSWTTTRRAFGDSAHRHCAVMSRARQTSCRGSDLSR